MAKSNLTERVAYFLTRVRRRIRFYFSKSYFTLFHPKVTCNICGWKDFRFNSDSWHPHTICPDCQSLVRHRLFWAILNNHKKFNKEHLIRDKAILHFAPEKGIKNCIKGLSKNYKTADFFTEGYLYKDIDYNIDICDMSKIENETFDCVIAFDVLEHVNDRKALSEINRIMKPQGIAILTVPMKDHAIATYEDPSIIDPVEREKAYGQFDHLRIYGEDFSERVSEQGFEVEFVDHTIFDSLTTQKNVLFPPILSKHHLATNHRKIYFAIKR